MATCCQVERTSGVNSGTELAQIGFPLIKPTENHEHQLNATQRIVFELFKHLPVRSGMDAGVQESAFPSAYGALVHEACSYVFNRQTENSRKERHLGRGLPLGLDVCTWKACEIGLDK